MEFSPRMNGVLTTQFERENKKTNTKFGRNPILNKEKKWNHPMKEEREEASAINYERFKGPRSPSVIVYVVLILFTALQNLFLQTGK